MIEYTTEGPIGYLTFNNPPANSYAIEFMEELGERVQQVAADEGVRVVIVRSALERFFSAGADIKAFTSNSPEQNLEMVRTAHVSLGLIARTPKLFIAQIGGNALGGGLEIALACDLRFAGEGQYAVGLPEATLGLLPGNGGTQRLPRLIGVARALDLMVTGRRLSPREAFELGIFDRLFPVDELAAQTRAYAEAIAHGATRAIGAIKLAVMQGKDKSLEEGLALERELLAPLFRGEEAREGFQAFAEKRKPVYYRPAE
ncbi:MAG: enoyl-CoA hydratase-related protein [Chloroflexi bacterium OHK40]